MRFSSKLIPSRAGHLVVWDWPTESGKYVIGADVAEGRVRDKAVVRRRIESRRDRPDYSAAVVLELVSGEHVASWHGWENTVDYADALASIGLTYNCALIVPELNGPGVAVTEHLLRVRGYPNLYRSAMLGKSELHPDQDGMTDFGWRTSQSSRAQLIHLIQCEVGAKTVRTRDRRLVRELRTLQYDEMGVPRAKNPDKDDMVFAYGLALQGRYELLVGRQDQSQVERQPDGPDEWVWRRKDRMFASWQANRGRLPGR